MISEEFELDDRVEVTWGPHKGVRGSVIFVQLGAAPFEAEYTIGIPTLCADGVWREGRVTFYNDQIRKLSLLELIAEAASD